MNTTAALDTDEAHLLRLHLAAHDAPCPVCGCQLRGVESTSCPECGAGLKLRVGSIDVKLGLWIATLVGLSMPLGWTTVWIVIMAVSIAQWSDGSSQRLALLAALGLFALTALMTALTWMLIRRRRRFVKMQTRRQVLYAVAAIVSIGPVTVATWALFMVTIWR